MFFSGIFFLFSWYQSGAPLLRRARSLDGRSHQAVAGYLRPFIGVHSSIGSCTFLFTSFFLFYFLVSAIAIGCASPIDAYTRHVTNRLIKEKQEKKRSSAALETRFWNKPVPASSYNKNPNEKDLKKKKKPTTTIKKPVTLTVGIGPMAKPSGRRTMITVIKKVKKNNK